VPVLSILRGTQSVKNLIRENKLHQMEGAVQTGKNAGMFTMERYKEDFLDEKDMFVSTVESFRPSTETDREIIYQSPIFLQSSMTTSGQTAKKMPESTERRPQAVVRSEHDIDGIEHILTIEEGTSIEELITKIDNK
jgi:hypothetical protein